jgi:plastocyanin
MLGSLRIRSLALVALAVVGLLLLQASIVLAAGARVTINNYQFTPKSIAVKPGSTITWTNRQADDNHTVTADDGSFDTGVINKNGGVASLTFATEGTFAYHCTIHPSMHGTVVVSANAVEAPSTDGTDFGTAETGGPIPMSIALMLLGVAFLCFAGGLTMRLRAARD